MAVHIQPRMEGEGLGMRCQDPASTSPLGSTGNVGGTVAHGVLLTLPAYSHFGRPHTPLCGLVVLAVSVTPGVVSSRLFSHAFAWARCSRGIRHAWRGLFAALLTRLCVGSLFSRYPSRPAWSLRGSSHTPLRGLVVLGSGGRSAGHGDREVGLWREIIDCVEKESPD